MKEENLAGISFFEKNLTLWVVLCMVAGVLIGKFLPAIPAFLSKFEYAKVSIPIAVLIWFMIYPMMMKVDFASIKNVGRNPGGLYLTWIVNWLIKPFTMFAIAGFFFFVVFSPFIEPDLARDYLAGAILLGAAPCTAMVFVWSHLTRGNPAYTVVQVATNDLIILVAFTPIVAFLLGVSGVTIPWNTLLLSVVLFVVIPLAGGVLTRRHVIKTRGLDYFNTAFIPRFNNATIVGLLLTLVLIFSFQGDTILQNPLHILLTQHSGPGGHDRRVQLLRAGRGRGHHPVRGLVAGGPGHHRRRAGGGSGHAGPGQVRQPHRMLVSGSAQLTQ